MEEETGSTVCCNAHSLAMPWLKFPWHCVSSAQNAMARHWQGMSMLTIMGCGKVGGGQGSIISDDDAHTLCQVHLRRHFLHARGGGGPLRRRQPSVAFVNPSMKNNIFKNVSALQCRKSVTLLSNCVF